MGGHDFGVEEEGGHDLGVSEEFDRAARTMDIGFESRNGVGIGVDWI